MGSYRLIRRLAVGGMAEVFLAKVVGAEGFEKPVAVKRMLPSLAADRSFIDLFLREAKLTVSLQHGNVVQVFDLGSVGGQYYLVMEFVDGENLRALLNAAAARGVSLGLREVCFIVQQVTAGLAYAHEKTDGGGRPLNIIHRDVNPSNVMISRGGEVKLADFGIAKAADGSTQTQAGVVKGKAGYLSPEQVAGREADQRSDLFLIGLLLHELLSGKRLFEAPNYFQALQLIGSFDASKLVPIPGVPAALWTIVTRALARDPAARFQRARDLADALHSFLFDHRLKVGPQDIGALFARCFPDRVSALESPLPDDAKGEEIRIGGEAATAAAAPAAVKDLAAAPPNRGSNPPPGEISVQHENSPPRPPPINRRRQLGELLVSRGRLTEAQLQGLLMRQQQEGGRLGDFLVAEGIIDEMDLVKALSEQAGIPYISDEKLARMEPPRDILKVLPREKAERLQAVPLSQRGKELYCAMRDPRDLAAVDQIKFITGSPVVRGVYATEGALRKALVRFYGGGGGAHTSWGTAVAVDDLGTPPAFADVTRAVEPAFGGAGPHTEVAAQPVLMDPPSPGAGPLLPSVPPWSPATPDALFGAPLAGTAAVFAPPSPAPPAPPPAPAAPPPPRPDAAPVVGIRTVLVVCDHPEQRQAVTALLSLQGVAAAAATAAEAEVAATRGGFDLVLTAEDAAAGVSGLATRLRSLRPSLQVRVLPSFGAALLGETGPLLPVTRLHSRALDSLLPLLGPWGAAGAPLAGLARRLARRLGGGAVEIERAAAGCYLAFTAARLESREPFAAPSMASVRAVIGSEMNDLSDVLDACSEGAQLGPDLSPAALAAAAAIALTEVAGSPTPGPAQAASSLTALRSTGRVPSRCVEVLAAEISENVHMDGTAGTVVVADPDGTSASSLQVRLLSEGMRILHARDASEVRSLLEDDGAMALIASTNLPDLGGVELTAEIREKPELDGLPIFLIAPRDDASAVTSGLDAGADDVLSRPVNVDVLVAKLRRALAARLRMKRTG